MSFLLSLVWFHYEEFEHHKRLFSFRPSISPTVTAASLAPLIYDVFSTDWVVESDYGNLNTKERLFSFRPSISPTVTAMSLAPLIYDVFSTDWVVESDYGKF
jgi:hypothetical protein